MDFQKRMDLLMKRADEEYEKLLKNADFSDKNLLKEARRIAAMDMIYRNLEGFLAGSPTDVETMLFYDRPLEAFYNSLQEQDSLLLNGVVEALNGFLTDSRKHIYEVWIQGSRYQQKSYGRRRSFLPERRRLRKRLKRKSGRWQTGYIREWQGTETERRKMDWNADTWNLFLTFTLLSCLPDCCVIWQCAGI